SHVIFYSNYGYGRFNKALTYELYNQFDESLKWYNKALEVEEYVWTYYGIASLISFSSSTTNTLNITLPPAPYVILKYNY
ncbi:TPR Domain protein, partial [human gut metagenome]